MPVRPLSRFRPMYVVVMPMVANALPDNVEQRSLDAESWREANEWRWYLSQEERKDVGESAIRKWVLIHWPGFLRARWLDHMMGRCFWLELNRDEFGMLNRDIGIPRPIVDELVEMMKCGAENLNLLVYARSKPPEVRRQIRQFLALVKINEHRLRCKFGED